MRDVHDPVHAVDAVDEAVDRWWDRLRGRPAVDRVMYTATNLGEFSRLWHALGTVQAIARRDPRRSTEVSVVMGIESLVVNGALKSLFGRRRPGSAADNPTDHHLRQPITSSFPSGHASAAFCASTVLARGSRYGWLYHVVAAVVASSRIHVRLHHASDVIAGALVGRALGRIANAVIGRR